MRASATASLSGAQTASAHRRSVAGQLASATSTNPSVAIAPSRRLLPGSALHALSPESAQIAHDTVRALRTLSRRPQPLGPLGIRSRRSDDKPPPTLTSAAAAATTSDAATTSSPAPRRTAGRAASLGDPQAKPAPRGAAARRAKEEATAAASEGEEPSRGRGRGRGSPTTGGWGSAGRGPGEPSSPAPVPRGASAAQLAKRAPAWMRLDEDEIERQRAELAADRAAKRVGDGDFSVTTSRSRTAKSASSLARARLARTEHAGSAKRALEAARKLEQETREARRLMSREGGTKPDYAAHAHPTREQWWAVEVPCSDARKASSVARWLEAAPRRVPRLEGVDAERVVRCYVPKKQVRAWSFRANKMGSRKVAFRDGAVVMFTAIMDQHLGEYIASSIIDVSSYDERKETAGRISGYHKRITFPGSQKSQVPLPLCFAGDGEGGEGDSELLREAREWEETEEIWDRATSWEHENPGTPLPPLPGDEDAPVSDVGSGAGKGAGLAAARAELAKAAQRRQETEKERASPPSTYLPAVRGRARETLEKAAYSEEARLAGFAKRVAEASRAAEAASAAAAGWNVGPPPPSRAGDRFHGDGGGRSGGDRKEYAPRGGARGRGGVSPRRAEPARTPRFGSGGGGGGWASNNGDEGDGGFRPSSSRDDDDDAFGVGGAWGDAAGGAGAGDESDGFGWRPTSDAAAAGSWLEGDDDLSPSKSTPSRKGRASDPIAATASRDAGSSADEDAWATGDGAAELAGESYDAGAVAARDYFESSAASDGAEGSWATSGARGSDDGGDVDGQDPSSWFDEGLEWE